ncbi:MAG: FAD binding domain-containing protein [Chloroflexi bacterium]|nr:FAD binding domain-containing protein [Chloroflexota bacterium]
MITTYHRPQTLEEALTLLSRPNTVPLGGGTLLSHPSPDPISVVDLQALGLNAIKKQGNNLELGATVTLQQLLESEYCPPALKTAIKLEAPLNLRNSATVAGTLAACNGRSTFACALLAFDAKLTVEGGRLTVDGEGGTSNGQRSTVYGLGDFLPLRPRGLITQITIPLNAQSAFEYVARTPSDKPIVCAALTQWNSGRARLAVGGWGKSPTLAMDGTEAEGLEPAARNACHEATDEGGSAEYRMDVAATLAKRCLENLGANP